MSAVVAGHHDEPLHGGTVRAENLRRLCKLMGLTVPTAVAGRDRFPMRGPCSGRRSPSSSLLPFLFQIEPEGRCFSGQYAVPDILDGCDHATPAAKQVIGQRHDARIGHRGR